MRTRTLHEKVEWLYGTGDLRLIYGMGTPVVVMSLLIVAAMAIGEVWLVPALMALVGVFTLVVLLGITRMLDEEETD